MTPGEVSSIRALAPMPIIVGAPRSGTTLLRFMLDSHPAVAIPPETGFLAAFHAVRSGPSARQKLFATVTNCPPIAPLWDNFGIDKQEYWQVLRRIDPFNTSDGLRAFYRLYAAKQGKNRYGDKTPLYCLHLGRIGRILPEAHFIHILRDGRDTAVSLRRMWFAPGKDMRTLARYWRNLVRTARQDGRRARHYLEVRYEDLVTNPEPLLRTVCRFSGLDFDAALLRYWERTPERLREHTALWRKDGTLVATREQRLLSQHMVTEPLQPALVCGWKNQLTQEERAEFERYAGDTLGELGYEV